MASNLVVLWVDDDSPKEPVLKFDDVEVFTAKSCEQAVKLLDSQKVRPQWVVVDLIVPQGNWDRNHLYRLPGIHLIHHLQEKYGGEVGTLAFSIVLPPNIRKKAIDAGATEAYAKTAKSMWDVIDFLRSHPLPDAARQPETGR